MNVTSKSLVILYSTTPIPLETVEKEINIFLRILYQYSNTKSSITNNLIKWNSLPSIIIILDIDESVEMLEYRVIVVHSLRFRCVPFPQGIDSHC